MIRTQPTLDPNDEHSVWLDYRTRNGIFANTRWSIIVGKFTYQCLGDGYVWCGPVTVEGPKGPIVP